MAKHMPGAEPRIPIGEAPELQVVESWRVCCDGGEGALGHPRVWLEIPRSLGWIDCGYCDKRYVHESLMESGRPVLPSGPYGETPGDPGRV